MLKHYGVIPYVVFDGGYLPSKQITESGRAKRREDALQLGLEYERLGNHKAAAESFQKGVDVTPEMARRLILALRQENHNYVVAPYEADAQLCYLEKTGVISAIITEDSDLLVFGCKKVLLKMDNYGNCTIIDRSQFSNLKGEVSLSGWTDDRFRHMAILSGCDYLANIPKMGLKTAYKLLQRYRSIDKVFKYIRLEGNYVIPNGYEAAFNLADRTFLYQRVFCPFRRKVVLLNEPTEGFAAEVSDYLGYEIDNDIAIAIARGERDPILKTYFEDRTEEVKRGIIGYRF